MATGRSSSGGSGTDWKEFLTCSVCLGIFRSPKLLPCHHSFCLPCLEDLASRHWSGSFPCPQCRRDVTVPSGGVAAFQSNFHVNPKDLEKARNGALCSIHPKHDMECYCVDCDELVCQICAITNHKPHTIEDLDKVARQAIQDLKECKDELRKIVSCMEDFVEITKTEQKSMQDKKSAMEKVIRRKQAWVKLVVDKYCEDSLASLTAVSEDCDSRLTKVLDWMQKILDQLCQRQQYTQEAIMGGEGCRVVSVAKEMKEWCDRFEAEVQLIPEPTDRLCWPVLSSKVAENTILRLVPDYLGQVEMMERNTDLKMGAPAEVKVKFCCGEEEENVEVFSLCPQGDGSNAVYVSFARRGVREDAPSETFDEEGKHVRTVTAATGKRSFKSRDNNKFVYAKYVNENFLRSYDKSHKKTIFRLESHLSNGTADIQTVTVVSEDPFNMETPSRFTISSGPHRAFDVDSSEQHYVVLEEPGPAPDIQRKVRLYHRGQRDAVATYRPPSAACRPSDVCFWRKPGGREILVVADEGTDSLHVVHVRDNKLKFKGHLAPGSPLITQPTALNTDTRGRLWVALRGGQIITVSGLKEKSANRFRDATVCLYPEDQSVPLVCDSSLWMFSMNNLHLYCARVQSGSFIVNIINQCIYCE